MAQVTIFEVNSIQTEGRLVHPSLGRYLTREELEEIISRTRVRIERKNGRVVIKLVTGQCDHKLAPPYPPDTLLERISNVVTGWFPREKGEIVILLEHQLADCG